MNVHFLQHSPHEGPDSIGEWLKERGHRLSVTHLYRGEKLPEAASVDWLVVMGGPMNVYQYRDHPWLRAEKRFMREVIERAKPVLGVCLGSQLLADILGGKVYQNAEKEIGWLPVKLAKGAETERVFGTAGGELTVFQWHGDTFDLPPGATRLAESEGCANQAFVCDRRLVGVQFHIEVTADTVAKLVKEDASDLTPGRYVQSAEQLLQSAPHLPPMRKAMSRLLEALEETAK